MSTATRPADVIHYRKCGQRVEWFTREDDPYERGLMLQRSLLENEPGDRFELPSGMFSYRQNPLKLDGVTLIGSHPVPDGGQRTLLTGIVQSDDLKSGAFSVGDTTLRYLCVESISDPDFEDDRCVSMDYTGTKRTVIDECFIRAGAWAVYGWPAGDSRWSCTITRTQISSGCQCLTGQGSGNPEAQSFSVADSTLTVDPMLSKCGQNQAVRHPVYGGSLAVVLRGGKHYFSNVKIRVAGGSLCANAACITDTYENGALDSLKIIAQNLDCGIDPNGTKPERCFDLRIDNVAARQSLKLLGASKGSGEFDSLRLSWRS